MRKFILVITALIAGLGTYGADEYRSLTINQATKVCEQSPIFNNSIGINVGSDATYDLLYRASTGKLARIPKGTAGQFFRVNAANNGYEFITPTASSVGLANVTNDAQLKIASNLSDLNNTATARSNLGLGDSATKNVGQATGDVAAGDHTHSLLHNHTNKTLLDSIISSGDGTKYWADDGTYKTVSGGGTGSTSDTDRGDGTAWTSTTSSPSQRANEKALNQVAIEPAKRADLLTTDDHGKLTKAYCTGNGIDSYTKLMLHLDGDTIDASPSAHTITNSGTTSDTSNKVFGSASRAFASGNYLSIPTSSDFALDGDFTFDFRIKTAGTGSIQSLFINPSSAFQISIDYSGHLQCYYINGTILVSSGTVTNNAWHHIAVVRNGSAFKFYIDGTNDGSVTESRSISTPTQPVIIGVNPSASQNFVGNIDEFRFSKGIARWTAGFTPPNSAYSEVAAKYTLSDVKDTDIVTTLTQGGSTGVDVISKSGNTLTSKKIKAGTNVTVSESGNEIAIAASGGSGSGDVVGPSSATDNAVCRFDSTTGKLIQNSQVTINDFGGIVAMDTITAPLVDPGTLRLTEESEPSSPAADAIYIYAKDKSGITAIYTKDSSGSVRELLNDLTGLANPMTASGDIIYGGTSGVATRLAKGSDGQVLKLASGVPTWAAESGGSAGITVSDLTADHTADNNEWGKMFRYTNSTTASRTFNFPTAANKNGSAPVIIKNKSGFNIIVEPYSSETIDGMINFPLEPGQTVRIVSDGTNLETF